MPILSPSGSSAAPGMYGLDIINRAARRCGVLPAGEQFSGSDANDALVMLQSLIDSYQGTDFLIFAEQNQTFPLTVGKQTYKLGIGGDFNISRPAKITRANIFIPVSGGLPVERPMSILDYNGYALIVQKGIQAAYPLNVYPDYQYITDTTPGPYMNVSFWVIPNVACSWVMWAWMPLTTWPDLSTTVVSLPPIYQRLIIHELAQDIWGEWASESPLDPLIPKVIGDCKLQIARLYADDPILSADTMYAWTGGEGIYDWRSDTFVNQSRR